MHFRPLVSLVALAAFVSVSRAGIELKNLDVSVKPQDDFFRYANGGWLAANPVPAAYSRWGAFSEVEDFNRAALHKILDHAATVQKPGLEKQVGDFYASGMDEAAIDSAGVTPLRTDLEHFSEVRSPAEIQDAIARLHRYGITAGFALGPEPDPKNSTMVIAANGQAGLGL